MYEWKRYGPTVSGDGPDRLAGLARRAAFSRLFRRPHPRYCGLHAICQERIP
jgi:hypothetical protein